MRKWTLLVGFCCIVSLANAQEFTIMEMGNLTLLIDKKLHDREYFLRYVNLDNWGKRKAAYDRLREEWLKSKKSELISPALDSLLSDTMLLEKEFTIYIAFNRDSSVFTLGFMIANEIYDRLPEGWEKDMYNRLIKLRIDVSRFWDFSSLGEYTKGEEYAMGYLEFSITDLKKGVIRPQREVLNGKQRTIAN